MRIKLIKTSARGFDAALKKIVDRNKRNGAGVEDKVAAIIGAVREKGDRALFDFTRRFDGVGLDRRNVEVSKKEIASALKQVPERDLRTLRLAARRIATFHRRQLEKSWGYRDPIGIYLGQRIAPLARAGVYVPGGKASYPSTVLMNAIPAKVAGVKEVVMTSPAGRDGKLNPLILAAAKLAGVHRVFRVGGAQAIAALAYGTESIPKVDKIVGPGNIYVATAKRLVFGEVAIDSIAGPSEILLLADNSADPEHVAADMLSQAEHDELAAALCVTPSAALAARIRDALERQTRDGKRRAITLKALENYGAIIVCRGLSEAVAIANSIAPEHIELILRKPERWARAIRNAGALFVGPYSAPPLGDYMAGPNHVLPTGGSARFFSPLGTYDFFKRMSVIRAEKRALKALAPEIARFARLEGLDDHARAVEARFKG